MDELALHELLSGRRQDVGAMLLRGALSVASWGYAAAVGLRNAAYDHGLLTVQKVDVPVISLGNLTTGGTGKTPTAAWLTNWLIGQGHRPGLLSRGYRSLTSTADQAEASSSAKVSMGNDEKLVLDRLCPGVPHLQQRDRVASAHRLANESGCDVLILDDGFQHRRLHRDLDLVLIDALQPWGYGRLLPRGLLREALRGLDRASLVLITRADQCSEADRIRLKERLARVRHDVECVEIAFRPQRLMGLSGEVETLQSVSSQKALAFCGIGNPRGFQQTLSVLGSSHEMRVFPDHYHYQQSDLDDLAQAAKAASAPIVLTTLKDLVKIPIRSWSGPPLFAVDIGVDFLSGKELLLKHLDLLLR